MVEVDMAGVLFADSAGLEPVVEAARARRDAGTSSVMLSVA
jgi:hypothetical protein